VSTPSKEKVPAAARYSRTAPQHQLPPRRILPYLHHIWRQLLQTAHLHSPSQLPKSSTPSPSTGPRIPRVNIQPHGRKHRVLETRYHPVILPVFTPATATNAVVLVDTPPQHLPVTARYINDTRGVLVPILLLPSP